MRVRWIAALTLGCAGPTQPDPPVDSLPDDTEVDTDVPDTDGESDDTDGGGGDTGTPPDPDDALRALGPTLWLRAADLVAAGGGNGDAVGVWPGVDGFGAAAGQDQPFRQPQLRLGLASPVPVVRFDGIDDRLDVPIAPLESDLDAEWTVVLAVRARGDGHLVGSGPSERVGDRRVGARVQVRDGAVSVLAAADLNGLVFGPSERVADDTFRVVSVVVRPLLSSVFLDGRLAGTTDRSPNPFPPNVVTLGAADGDGIDAAIDPFAGDLAEVLVVPRALSTCERWLAEARLGASVGVTTVRDTLPPYFHYVADDALAADGEPVAEVPARTPPGLSIGALRAIAAGADLPRLAVGAMGAASVLRFDGVDDRLDLPLSLVSGDAFAASTTFAVFRTTDTRGVLLGAAPSYASSTLVRAAGLLVEDGRVGLLTRTADGEAGARSPVRIDDGQPHVVVGALTESDVTLWLDGVGTPGAGNPEVLGEARASLGAADGQALGAAVDPLAMDLAEVRQYRFVMDSCARPWVERELATRYGIAVP